MISGQLLPSVHNIKSRVNGNTISLFWNPPTDKRSSQWSYGIYVFSPLINDFGMPVLHYDLLKQKLQFK